MQRFNPAGAERTAALVPSSAPPIHDVHNLTQGGTLARILLDGKEYTLRITRAGKLILTK